MAATDEIALVPVGPLTNVAMALKLEPRIVERIPRTLPISHYFVNELLPDP